MSLVPCKRCNAEISSRATECPKCGEPDPTQRLSETPVLLKNKPRAEMETTPTVAVSDSRSENANVSPVVADMQDRLIGGLTTPIPIALFNLFAFPIIAYFMDDGSPPGGYVGFGFMVAGITYVMGFLWYFIFKENLSD